MKLDYNQIGMVLLVIGVVAIAFEGALAAAWSFRLSRQARALNERLAEERGRLQGDVERLRLAMAETQALWQPYGKLLRWLRHPLTVALIRSFARRQSFARRRAGAR